jgi:hypothetical protein
MRIARVIICLIGPAFITACSEPPPPVSVNEFMENPRLLEATMVRCGQNRAEMKYESECVNARDAINRLERAEERARRADLDAQSERKRQALRRTQEAAAAARRRAEEARRQREEDEYLGIFENAPQNPSTSQQAGMAPTTGNAPGVSVAPAPVAEPEPAFEPEPEPEIEPVQQTMEPEELPPETSDLSQIREELRKRQQSSEENQ